MLTNPLDPKGMSVKDAGKIAASARAWRDGERHVAADRRTSIANRRLMPSFRRPPARRLRLCSARKGLDPGRSDVDFLVAFEPTRGPSLGDYLALRDAAAVGRPVDLVVEGSVRNPFIRAGIERPSEALYGT